MVCHFHHSPSGSWYYPLALCFCFSSCAGYTLIGMAENAVNGVDRLSVPIRIFCACFKDFWKKFKGSISKFLCSICQYGISCPHAHSPWPVSKYASFLLCSYSSVFVCNSLIRLCNVFINMARNPRRLQISSCSFRYFWELFLPSKWRIFLGTMVFLTC